MTEKAYDLKQYLISKAEKKIREANALFKFNQSEKKEYKILLDHFLAVNNSKNSTSVKGKSLEKLVEFLLSKSVVFETLPNVRTSSNEIDLLVRLNSKGKYFKKQGLLDFDDKFLSECKNYDKKISVTWVGKFFSLMNYTKNDLGILFSYNGFSGKGWNDAAGLSKKIALANNGVRIIDFNKNDFELLLLDNHNFISIINDKIFTLENDISFTNYIKAHPNQDLF